MFCQFLGFYLFIKPKKGTLVMIARINGISFSSYRKILVADDEESVRELHKFTLKRSFLPEDILEIVNVKNLGEAEKAFNPQNVFDLVVTDGHMGTSSCGIDTITADGIKVAEMAKARHIPVILCSGDNGLKGFSEKAGAFFLEKKNTAKDLKQLVQNIFNPQMVSKNLRLVG